MRNDLVLQKIIMYATKITTHCEHIGTEKEFMTKNVLVRSVAFNLKQIGLQACKVDKPFRRKFPDIPWTMLCEFKNAVPLNQCKEKEKMLLAWRITKQALPEVIRKLEKIV